MQVWNVLHVARCKCRTQKSRQKSPSGYHRTTLSGYIFATKARIDNRKKNLLSSNISSTCPHNMVTFGPLAAETVSLVWGTPGNFNGFRVLAALLHGISVVGVSQTLRRWTEDATYIRQGGHHVGHWPTFLVSFVSYIISKYITVLLYDVCLSHLSKYYLLITCLVKSISDIKYSTRCYSISWTIGLNWQLTNVVSSKTSASESQSISLTLRSTSTSELVKFVDYKLFA